jgi:hypothetical protein
MGNVSLTVANVRPLEGAIMRRAIAGEALAFGDAVYVSTYSGDKPVVSKASGAAIDALIVCYGVVVSTQADLGGATSVAISAACDVVVLGPVTGYTGMTSGAHIWVSDTAGLLSTTVGTKSCVVGLAESPTVVFVRPGQFTAST